MTNRAIDVLFTRIIGEIAENCFELASFPKEDTDSVIDDFKSVGSESDTVLAEYLRQRIDYERDNMEDEDGE